MLLEKPEFTPKELTLIANMVVGRYDSLVELSKSPTFPDKKGIAKAIKAVKSVADKLRPYYTGEDT